MSDMGFRSLRADEIEVRVSQIVEGKGVFLLLYKDARCDMRILDEVVGAERWQREHYEVKGRMFCRVGINIDGEWIWKADCGTESNTEAVKGESSDSFKRACFCWGIGRELYTAPRIWIPSSVCNIKKNNKGKLVCFDNFEVKSVEVQDGKITALKITCNGKLAYKLGQAKSEDDLAAAKQRLWAAEKAYAAANNTDPKRIAEGVCKRPDYEETAEFFNAVAEEFESNL